MKQILCVVLLGILLPISNSFAGKDFYKKDFRDKETELVELAGQRLSHDHLTFVVHGGNKKLMMIAYKVAQRLDDEGVPVAFLLAPDWDDIAITMHVDYYARGGTKFGYSAYDNHKTTPEKTEAGLYEWAMRAYKEEFLKVAKE